MNESPYFSQSILQSPIPLPDKMLCSISTSGKSTSGWLHRLRSSKGFPSATDLDLDQFLSHHQSHNHDSTDQPGPKPNNDPDTQTNRKPEVLQNPSEGKELFSIMSNVLAELFIMGDHNSFPKIQPKKCSRKQPNPRFCVPMNSSDFSNDASNENNEPRKSESASPVSDDNSVVGVNVMKELCSDQPVKLAEYVNYGDDEDEEKEKGYGNLSGFSRTEVTVIDTSFATWKFDKMLFRKKNVWKVRDKKGKTMNCGKKKKKRKSTTADTENICGVEVKKPKVLIDGQCGLSKKASGGAVKEEYNQNNKSQTVCKKISDTFRNALKKKQATLNLENGSSSVILIKSIPPSKKTGTSIQRSCTKSTNRQLKG